MTNSKKSNFSQLTMIQLRSKLADYIVKDGRLEFPISDDTFTSDIYIAAPWFTPKDKDIMDYLTEEVDRYKEHINGKVYFPIQHNCQSPKETFKQNLKAIDTCDTVIALIMSKDIGTAMEIGYAKARGKNIIAVVYDESCLYYKTNIMIAYAANYIIKLKDIIPYILGAYVNVVYIEDTWEGKE